MKRMATELNLNPDLYKKIGEIGKFDAKNPDGDRGAAIFGGKGTEIKNYFYISLKIRSGSWESVFETSFGMHFPMEEIQIPRKKCVNYFY